jgi:hypothetical protein
LQYLGRLFGVDRKKVAITTSVKFIVWHRLALRVADRINLRKNSDHFQKLVDGMHSAVSFFSAAKGFEAALWSCLFLLIGIGWFCYKKPTKSENFSFKFSETFLSMRRLEHFLNSKRVRKVFVESLPGQKTLTNIEYEDPRCSRWKSSKVIVSLCIDSNSNGFLYSAKVRLTRKIDTLQLNAQSVKRMLLQDMESYGLKNNNTLQDINRIAMERKRHEATQAAAKAEALYDAEQNEIEAKIAEYNLQLVDDTTQV